MTICIVAAHSGEIKAQAYLGGLQKVTRLIIPEGVTKIGAGAFANNPRLVSVRFPSTLRGLGGGAFANCKRLTDVNLANWLLCCLLHFIVVRLKRLHCLVPCALLPLMEIRVDQIILQGL